MFYSLANKWKATLKKRVFIQYITIYEDPHYAVLTIHLLPRFR
jgi:hypothetical protein